MIADASGGRPVAARHPARGGGRWFYNSLRVLEGDGRARRARYDKHHLVPFGEYIPFGDLAYALVRAHRLCGAGGHGYSAGPGPAVLDLGPLRPGAAADLLRGGLSRSDVRAAPRRADWMLQITNDAWFGTLTGPFQHFAQARLRAVEQGLPLVRVAKPASRR